jgi:hypothetical protein
LLPCTPDASISPSHLITANSSRLLPLHKLQRLLPTHDINATRLISPKHDTVAFIRHKDHLWPEGRANELSRHATRTVLRTLTTLLLRNRLEHLCDCSAVLGVEVGIDFVEEIEGCGVALLDGEDKGESAETWMILVGDKGRVG